VDIDPRLQFRDDNRRLLGGDLIFKLADGSERPLHLNVLGDTGFHLGAGLYFGLDGHHHGEWRGKLNVEGEHQANCADPKVARRLHQLRDCLVEVEDPIGGGRGWGNIQTIATGAFPEMGLSVELSFT
jgi:hypothetical protein